MGKKSFEQQGKFQTHFLSFLLVKTLFLERTFMFQKKKELELSGRTYVLLIGQFGHN